ncbi:unannotated protein [freshwater metagenome]|uniref:Unannotated protein n=1 Tax=freshwater metagenome TaxID=449393 RepID=A0A6J6GZF2_9ZZZZ
MYLIPGFAAADAVTAGASAYPTPTITVHFLSTNFFTFSSYDLPAGKYSTEDA